DADDVLVQARRLTAPTGMATARDLLLATLAIRKETTVSLSNGLSSALGNGSGTDAVNALTEAGRDIIAGDRSYELFQKEISPKVGNVDDSRWASDPTAGTRRGHDAVRASRCRPGRKQHERQRAHVDVRDEITKTWVGSGHDQKTWRRRSRPSDLRVGPGGWRGPGLPRRRVQRL